MTEKLKQLAIGERLAFPKKKKNVVSTILTRLHKDSDKVFTSKVIGDVIIVFRIS